MKLTLNVLVAILAFFCFSCNPKLTKTQVNNKAQDVFINKVKVVELFLKEQYIEEYKDLEEAIDFFQETTNIQSDVKYQVEKFYTPTEKNLQDWKNWYKINKDLLYWDEKEQKIKLNNN